MHNGNGLEPLPVLTSRQWRALPEEEKQRLRALKKAHRAAESSAKPKSSIDITRASPFCDHAGNPVRLDYLGNGGQCFIVLSGPSIRTLDLSLLSRRGVFTIAVNNAGTIVRPNAWIYVDTPDKFHESLWLDPAVLKFVHFRHLRRRMMLRHKLPNGEFETLQNATGRALTIADMPGVIGIDRNADFRPERWLEEPQINWGNGKNQAAVNGNLRCLNVMFAVLKLAYSLGFRVVYLLGCDFLMSFERPYAFGQDKEAAACISNNESYRTMNAMFRQLRPRFDAAGYRVFNCNPRSGLTVFPACRYEDAIEAATSHIPQDPIDASGWYYK